MIIFPPEELIDRAEGSGYIDIELQEPLDACPSEFRCLVGLTGHQLLTDKQVLTLYFSDVEYARRAYALFKLIRETVKAK